MSDQLQFKANVWTATYGDGRKFADYRLWFLDKGAIVGMEGGPRRSATTRKDAMTLARARIAVLKTHRLFAIHVTKKHISDGEGRNCDTCAISQALWHNQERMGFPKPDYSFAVCPYACFTDAYGIALQPKYGGNPDLHIPDDKLPEVVWPSGNHDHMVHWAMNFDDWYDSQCMSLKDWRKQHGYRDGERPFNPGPMSFVLDLDAFVPMT